MPKRVSLTDRAYAGGRDAFALNLAIERNPWQSGSPAHIAWQLGWRDAQREATERLNAQRQGGAAE